jgi:dTMP kinase
MDDVFGKRKATDRLIQAGFDVLRVDCNQRPAEQAAAFIRHRLFSFFAAKSTG